MPSGSDPYADVLAILDAQARVYEQLGEVAEARHAALVDADAERLEQLVAHEQPLLSRIHRLEVARLQAVRPWAEHLHLRPEDITISLMTDIVDPAAGGALHAAKERLLDAIRRVEEANRRNAALLESCLDSVNSSIQHLLQTVQLDPRYASTGNRAGPEAGPRLTDYRA